MSQPPRSRCPVTVRPERHAYGTGAARFGDLYRPPGEPAGTVVLVHGGFWRARYDLTLMEPLARDLAARGRVVWNIEYRRLGDGGGWPATFHDVAAAFDHLATLPDVDTGTGVVAIGHSAGGHLAVWAAARPRLPVSAPGARPVVVPGTVVSLAGVLDLAGATRLSAGAVLDLLGGGPADVPDRYAVADPTALLPIGATVHCVHAPADADVPFEQSRGYVRRAREHGGRAGLVAVDGDHFTVIDPGSAAWARVLGLIGAVNR